MISEENKILLQKAISPVVEEQLKSAKEEMQKSISTQDEELKSATSKIEALEEIVKALKLQNSAVGSSIDKNMNQDFIELQKAAPMIAAKTSGTMSIELKKTNSSWIKNASIKSIGSLDNATLGGAFFQPSAPTAINQTITSNITKILDEVETMTVENGKITNSYPYIIYEGDYRTPAQERAMRQAATEGKHVLSSKTVYIQTGSYVHQDVAARQLFNSGIINFEQSVMQTIYEKFNYNLAYDILKGDKNSGKFIGKLSVPDSNLITMNPGSGANPADALSFKEIVRLINEKNIPMSVLENSVIILNMKAFMDLRFELGTTGYYKNEAVIDSNGIGLAIGNMRFIIIDNQDMPYESTKPILYLGNLKKSYRLHRSEGGIVTFNHQFDQVKTDAVSILYEEVAGGLDIGAEKYMYGIKAI